MPETPTVANRFEILIESAPWNHRGLPFALGALLLGVDYWTGPELVVPVYFVLPVMLLAWNWGARLALVLVAMLALTHLALLTHWGISPTGVLGVLNTMLRTSVLLLLMVMTARLGKQARASRVRVQILEGLLPTCSFCKDIRNEDNEWERIESYLGRHSAAEFSHSLCPPCAEKHYGYKPKSPAKTFRSDVPAASNA